MQGAQLKLPFLNSTGMKRRHFSAIGRTGIMEWDFTSVGLVLIGSSITVAGIIIAALLMGIVVTGAPFLLITTTVIIVMSAILIIFSTPRSKPPI